MYVPMIYPFAREKYLLARGCAGHGIKKKESTMEYIFKASITNILGIQKNIHFSCAGAVLSPLIPSLFSSPLPWSPGPLVPWSPGP